MIIKGSHDYNNTSFYCFHSVVYCTIVYSLEHEKGEIILKCVIEFFQTKEWEVFVGFVIETLGSGIGRNLRAVDTLSLRIQKNLCRKTEEKGFPFFSAP